MMALVYAHLNVKSGVFRQVPVSVGILGAEDRPDLFGLSAVLLGRFCGGV